MFAIVEFDNKKKEFAVLPFIWLTEDNAMCYWPRNVSQSILDDLIVNLSEPKKTWQLYPVKKIHGTGETYIETNNMFTQLLQERSSGTSSEGNHNIAPVTPAEEETEDFQVAVPTDEETGNPTRMIIEESLAASVRETGKRKKYSQEEKENKQSKVSRIAYRRADVASYSSNSSDESYQEQMQSTKRTSAEKRKQNRMNHKRPLINHNYNCSSSDDELRSEEHIEITRTDTAVRVRANQEVGLSYGNTSVASTSSTPTTTSRSHERSGNILPLPGNHLGPYENTIFKSLESIKVVLEQNTILLQEILTTVRTKNLQSLHRPNNTPELPINHKKDFATFDTWLSEESNFTYMRSRVAAVGGSTVRSATMNMLKFLITNKLGMSFNWAGSAPKENSQKRKRPFKLTNVWKLINEAVKLAFSGREGAVDLSDFQIIKAVQDWLKLSRSRYEYSLRP